MDIRHEDMARSMRREDVSQPTDGTKRGSEVDIAPASTEPNVVQLGSEQHVPLLVAPIADAVGQLQ